MLFNQTVRHCVLDGCSSDPSTIHLDKVSFLKDGSRPISLQQDDHSLEEEEQPSLSLGKLEETVVSTWHQEMRHFFIPP
ncbi:unnamed protein product [Linum trigynum]|uniref:Uncharacterized protein n=1 Tax=Linum trigynum TaxID=586398 RepID=A0AAV2F9L1_9ROSI